MMNIPEKYILNKKIPIKEFIPMILSSNIRKNIKNNVKKVVLTYQIYGEEIPSLINDIYNCQLIQFYDFELENIKKAKYISEIYQRLIKSLCVLRIYDNNKEIYSFALKRLNQNDKNEIVVSDEFLTEEFETYLPSFSKRELGNIISFEKILNKSNKVNFYFEMYTKVFIQKYQKIYQKSKEILEKPIWYDESKSKMIYELFKNMIYLREKIEKINLASEKVKCNQEIREILKKIEEIGGI
ncbi:DUF4391 domain-containing protein [Fusobacterium animalis]|uniref:DUF4391 domain-containing protein n=1 Tax=Fusobacterium animalis 4_8 TaxID=469607 RepID=R9RCX4_9FUSO|nr:MULTISPECIES: DUF4391 domain-containing protein [Fusobacterium]AGM23712.1 hypothetical protein HMPREF0409_00466 [Fusobacterium animalis 4_8]EEW95261.1 hypothetical protein HMPREF0406_00683 [Fusobacterium animalis 3_1_33]MCG6843848.1 DUF4391 domain-containing protein [Fusobacterium nucleatum]